MINDIALELVGQSPELHSPSVFSYCQKACALAAAQYAMSYLETGIQANVLKEKTMPLIAWLLGVPITVILLLMLFGVF